jgi:hypothetical protein
VKKLKPQKVDWAQIERFLQSAEKKLVSAHKILAFDEEACLQQAYEAMLKASLGFMFSHGFRARLPVVDLRHDCRLFGWRSQSRIPTQECGLVFPGTFPSALGRAPVCDFPIGANWTQGRLLGELLGLFSPVLL